MKEIKRKALIYLQGMVDGINIVKHCDNTPQQERTKQASAELNIVIETLKDLDIITDKDLKQLDNVFLKG